MRPLLALVLLALSVLPATASDHTWLVDKWELTHATDSETRSTSTYEKVP